MTTTTGSTDKREEEREREKRERERRERKREERERVGGVFPRERPVLTCASLDVKEAETAVAVDEE